MRSNLTKEEVKEFANSVYQVAPEIFDEEKYNDYVCFLENLANLIQYDK